MKRYFPSLVLAAFFSFLFSVNAQSQCGVTVQDSLLPGLNLQLVGIPTGVPPFTFTWTINGGVSGTSITPTYVSATGDTIIIANNDLFSNYGCVFFTLCIQDSTGCSNCLNDTAYTNAINCYSAFDWIETQPGQLLITQPNPVPEFIGMTLATWTENGQQMSTGLMNGSGTLTYNPSVYNANGYDVPVCVQTVFQNSSFFCISCDTVHVSAVTPSAVSNQETILPFKIMPNPVSDVFQITVENKAEKTYCRLTDLSGRLLQTAESSDGKLTMSMSALPSGIYLVHVSSFDFSRTEKIIKQ